MAARDNLSGMFEGAFRDFQNELGMEIQGMNTQRMSVVSHSGRVRIPVMRTMFSHDVVGNMRKNSLKMHVPHESGAFTRLEIRRPSQQDVPRVTMYTPVSSDHTTGVILNKKYTVHDEFTWNQFPEIEYKDPEHLSKTLREHHEKLRDVLQRTPLGEDAKWHPDSLTKPDHIPNFGAMTITGNNSRDYRDTWGRFDERGRFVSHFLFSES